MRVAISHETVYRYRTPANYSVQYLRMMPLSGPTQRVLSWKITAPGRLSPWTDGFGNAAHTLVVEDPHDEVRVTATGEVEIADGGQPLLSDAEPLAPLVFLRSTRLTQADDRVIRFAAGFKPAVIHSPRKGLDNLMAGIRESVAHTTGKAANDVALPPREALEKKAGTARDHAHLFVTCCRTLGMPARYVSGYLCSVSAGRSTQMASHDWAEAWLDGTGWLSYDVINAKSNANARVRVAVGLDHLDAAPVRSFRRGGGSEGPSIDITIGDAVVVRQTRERLRQQFQQQQ